jgi:hypothetical protein
MASFRCFFINDADTVDGFESIEDATEHEALRRAYGMLQSNSLAVAVEVWQAGRLVSRIPRGAEEESARI